MTDMTLEQVRDELRRLASDGGFGQMADAIDAHLAKAAQGEVVETDQSIQADCYEMIADKYEAVGMSPASIVETSEYLADAWSAFQDLPDDTIDRLLVGKATEGDQSLVYGAISYIRDLQNESVATIPADYERAVTEQAMLTECVSVTGRDPSDVIRDVIQWHVSNAAQPVEPVDVSIVQDWKWCPKCGKRWGEDVHGTDDFSVCAGCEHDAKLAQSRPVGVRHEAFFAVLRERVEHFERIGKVGGKYIDGRRHEARLILDCCNEALLAAAPDGEVG